MYEVATKDELLSGSSGVGVEHVDSVGGSNLVMFGTFSHFGIVLPGCNKKVENVSVKA